MTINIRAAIRFVIALPDGRFRGHPSLKYIYEEYIPENNAPALLTLISGAVLASRIASIMFSNSIRWRGVCSAAALTRSAPHCSEAQMIKFVPSLVVT